MTLNDLRSDFERWAREHNLDLDKDQNGDFESLWTEGMWAAWKASASLYSLNSLKRENATEKENSAMDDANAQEFEQ